MLEEGHETVGSTVLDAEVDEVLDMPSDSWWPVTMAVALSAMFTMLLLTHFVTAGVFLVGARRETHVEGEKHATHGRREAWRSRSSVSGLVTAARSLR